MGELSKASKEAARFLAKAQWGLAVQLFFVGFSVTTLHYAFYMLYFGESLLLLYAADFYFQFCFVLLLYVAVAFLIGNVLYYSRFEPFIFYTEIALGLRRFGVWRKFRIYLHLLRRRRYSKYQLVPTIGAVFFFLLYLGLLRGAFLIILLFLCLILFAILHADGRKLTLFSARVSRQGIGPAFGKLFGNAIIGASLVHSSSDFRKMLWNSLNISSVFVVAVLLAAAGSGALRAERISQGKPIVFETKSGELEGIVYASAGVGILLYDPNNRLVVFLPSGSFSASLKVMQ